METQVHLETLTQITIIRLITLAVRMGLETQETKGALKDQRVGQLQLNLSQNQK